MGNILFWATMIMAIISNGITMPKKQLISTSLNSIIKSWAIVLMLDENVELEKNWSKGSLIIGVQNWGRGFIQIGNLDKALEGC